MSGYINPKKDKGQNFPGLTYGLIKHKSNTAMAITLKKKITFLEIDMAQQFTG